MATTSLTGLGGVDTRDFSRFARALRRAAPESSRGLRRALRTAGELVAADARMRAGEWSESIPPTIRTRVRGATVYVEAGGKGAPFAAAMEDGSKGNRHRFNRHPVFAQVGSREYRDPHRWVNQPIKPYLGPAVDAQRAAVAALVLRALDDAVTVAVTAERA